MTARELPMFLDAGTHQTFAVVTEPESPAGTGVVLLAGAGIAAVGNARLWVGLSRELGARGHWVVRLDHRGAGESTGEVGDLDLTEPFTADALAAAGWLAGRTPDGIALVGECFGARTALDCVGALGRPRGMVLLFPPVAMGARDEAGRRDLRDKLDRAISAGVPLAAVYGADDVDRPEFEELVKGRVPVAVEPGKLHGIASIEARDGVRRHIMSALHRFGLG
ncbi:alpha/beta hydrolase [Dactylosporangium sp. NPDC051485]|uniref:alpha/beta hydrolase n=1 Tax=Dactylosporangium sp. NPDC051485 TaxID=3154846 RepID=UPI003413A345